jgi:hypothetical protein
LWQLLRYFWVTVSHSPNSPSIIALNTCVQF